MIERLRQHVAAGHGGYTPKGLDEAVEVATGEMYIATARGVAGRRRNRRRGNYAPNARRQDTITLGVVAWAMHRSTYDVAALAHGVSAVESGGFEDSDVVAG